MRGLDQLTTLLGRNVVGLDAQRHGRRETAGAVRPEPGLRRHRGVREVDLLVAGDEAEGAGDAGRASAGRASRGEELLRVGARAAVQASRPDGWKTGSERRRDASLL